MAWFVYLIECSDGSLYTGIAVDVDARYAAQARGKGARYTRAHPPARLLARKQSHESQPELLATAEAKGMAD